MGYELEIPSITPSPPRSIFEDSTDEDSPRRTGDRISVRSSGSTVGISHFHLEHEPRPSTRLARQQPTSSRLWQSVTPRPALSPVADSRRPTSPLAAQVFDLATQLEDFHMSVNVDHLPIQGLNGPGSRVGMDLHAVLGNQGRVMILETSFNPGIGPRPLPGAVPEALSQVPIIWPFVTVKLLRLSMNPETHRLEGRVEYLFLRINREVHGQVLEMAQLPASVSQGQSYRLSERLPQEAWQWTELIENYVRTRAESRGEQFAPTSLLASLTPLFREGRIRIEGGFRNETLQTSEFQLHFTRPLQPGPVTRFRMEGTLTDPTLHIEGFKGVDFSRGGQSFRLQSLDGEAAAEVVPEMVFECHLPLESGDHRPFSVRMPSYHNRQVSLEVVQGQSQREREHPVKLILHQGVDVRDAEFRFQDEGLQLTIGRVTAYQAAIEGFGVHIQTDPNSRVDLTNIRVVPVQGAPDISADIQGHASGALDYVMGDDRFGHFHFNHLTGEGHVRIQRDPSQDNQTMVELAGNLRTQIPDLRLRVNSPELHGFVQTNITNASVEGVGRLRVWPLTQRALLENDGQGRVQISGSRGDVVFHQETSQLPEVQAWFQGRTVPPHFNTHLRVDFNEIRFALSRLELQTHVSAPVSPTSGAAVERGEDSSALLINQALIEPILVRGAVSGRLIFPFEGTPFPFDLSPQGSRSNIQLSIGRLEDHVSSGGQRLVSISDLTLHWEELVPTLSRRDQRNCGFDRQMLQGSFHLFEAQPGLGSVRVDQNGPFRLRLRNAITGGCIEIE